MRKFLAALISSFVTALLVSIYLTSDYSNLVGNLHFNLVNIYLGHAVFALPLSFIADRLSSQLSLGRFFIEWGLYLLIGPLLAVLLAVFTMFLSLYLIPISFIFPITYTLVKKIPASFLKRSLTAAVLLSVAVIAAMYYSIR
ncbi:hypothetical protein [Halobacillus kuroshimensis]|uniref:hypothetical protein n=1 Tax=Halobacillus kuroshimensis TaxID=302481 RepID=UPI0012EBE6EE|nr:hypothetical protein [Halobacillus kuroshimensis]